MYLSLSSTTIPEPLSAFLIIRVLFFANCFSVVFSLAFRLGMNGSLFMVSMSCSILCRYFSMSSGPLGGVQVLLALKGCGLLCG